MGQSDAGVKADETVVRFVRLKALPLRHRYRFIESLSKRERGSVPTVRRSPEPRGTRCFDVNEREHT